MFLANWGGTEGWQPQILYRAIEGQIASVKNLVDTETGSIYRGNPANAGVTQLVECNLAKVDVASSNLVTRSPLHNQEIVNLCRMSYGGYLRHFPFLIQLDSF